MFTGVPLNKGLCKFFIRLRLNTEQLAAGMKGVAPRRSFLVLHSLGVGGSVGGVWAMAQFRSDTPQLAAGSFICDLGMCGLER